eukprot:jgi/Psemu1/285638/fgenesh1_pg.95_\
MTAGTAVRKSRQNATRQFERRRNRRLIGNLFSTADASATRTGSVPSILHRHTTTNSYFVSRSSCFSDGIVHRQQPKYNQNQQQHWIRPPLLHLHPCVPTNNRWFATSTRNTIRKRGRKKKILAPPSHTQKVTTKDRLRLSARPSRSSQSLAEKNNNEFFGLLEDTNRLVVKSPEEVVERLNSGLDMARAAVRETYASLRNNNNPEAVAVAVAATAGKNTKRNEIVMDTNWWFWNLLFAASPAILIGLYCEFIVKPEMKERYEEREREASESLGGGDESGTGSDPSHRKPKLSPMRQRQEEQQRDLRQQQRDEREEAASDQSSSSSSLPPIPWSSDTGTGGRSNNILETFSSYVKSLLSASPESPLRPSRLPESNGERDDARDNRSDRPRTHQDQTVSKSTLRDEQQRLQEQQQRELNELRAQIRLLTDRIETQIDSGGRNNNNNNNNSSSGGWELGTSSDNDPTKGIAAKDEKQESIWVSIEGTTQALASAGATVGRRWLGSVQWWWQRGDQNRPSATEINRGGDGNESVGTENSDETRTRTTANPAALEPSIPRE